MQRRVPSDGGGPVEVLDSGTVTIGSSSETTITTAATDPNINVDAVVGLASAGNQGEYVTFVLNFGSAISIDDPVSWVASWDEPNQVWELLIANLTDSERDFDWYFLDWQL
jgi:hypothetical protein